MLRVIRQPFLLESSPNSLPWRILSWVRQTTWGRSPDSIFSTNTDVVLSIEKCDESRMIKETADENAVVILPRKSHKIPPDCFYLIYFRRSKTNKPKRGTKKMLITLRNKKSFWTNWLGVTCWYLRRLKVFVPLSCVICGLQPEKKFYCVFISPRDWGLRTQSVGMDLLKFAMVAWGIRLVWCHGRQ